MLMLASVAFLIDVHNFLICLPAEEIEICTNYFIGFDFSVILFRPCLNSSLWEGGVLSVYLKHKVFNLYLVS